MPRRPTLARPQVVVAHFAFDAARVYPIAAGADAFLENLLEHRFMKGLPVLRGE
jgi:hypothetical protein